MAKADSGFFDTLRGDIFGGVTAAVVALPLALAFGVASGVGPIAGLYGAIAAGFFAAVFGGTRQQVTGPTGPMTVVMAAIVATHADNLPEAFLIVMMGGALQILFGVLRLGRYIMYTPYSVVSGFMSGIGFIIIIIQILPFIGLPVVAGGPTGTIRTLMGMGPENINSNALTLALITLAVITFWPGRLSKYLPSALAALIVGTILGATVLAGVPVIGEVPTGLPSIVVTSVDIGALGPLIQPALILALLGTIDSLLTSLIADSITRTQHNSNRELIGQGIGNMAAGLIGGLPGAGATMRTVINVRAGGKTRLSGAIHALVLLALVLGLGPLAELVPHPVLAGILMKVGFDIIDWPYIRRLLFAPRAKVVVMLITLTLTVLVDLIVAVAVGIIIASFVTSRSLEQEELRNLKTSGDGDGSGLSPDELALLKGFEDKVLVTMLGGTFSYASARELARRVAQHISNYSVVVYDFTGTSFMDTSTANTIKELIEDANTNGQTVFVAGADEPALSALKGLGVLRQVPAENRKATRIDAIRSAVAAAGDA